MFEISFRNKDFSFYVKTSYFSEESKTHAEGEMAIGHLRKVFFFLFFFFFRFNKFSECECKGIEKYVHIGRTLIMITASWY